MDKQKVLSSVSYRGLDARIEMLLQQRGAVRYSFGQCEGQFDCHLGIEDEHKALILIGFDSPVEYVDSLCTLLELKYEFIHAADGGGGSCLTCLHEHQVRAPGKIDGIEADLNALQTITQFEMISRGRLAVPVRWGCYRAELGISNAAFILSLFRIAPKTPGVMEGGPIRSVPLYSQMGAKDIVDIATALCMAHDREFYHYYAAGPSFLTESDPKLSEFEVYLDGEKIPKFKHACALTGCLRQAFGLSVILPKGSTVLSYCEDEDKYLVERRGKVEIKKRVEL